nr:alpha-glucosidase/alpha-galactosidase [Oscillospiraceae bacterium]
MKYTSHGIENLKIAYIGGGSRGWAWKLMSDLAVAGDVSGQVDLYDINYEAAHHNEIIGNKFNDAAGATTKWTYHARRTIGEALTGADFVIISILPATFDEMESDVHTPEKYGIYQPVGDTTGPGGIIRALRTIPMIEVIAKAIEKYCPNAWVINYTNPMALCIKSLYDTFPGIKAFGCCHEVFAVQELIAKAVKEATGAEITERKAVKTNVLGVNHFTWITDARYHNLDVNKIYHDFVEKYCESGVPKDNPDSVFECAHRVKFDLYKRYGVIAAAGDRHLSEFCEGSWYLKNDQQISEWDFVRTPVSWRKEDLNERIARSERLCSGEEEVTIQNTGEDGVRQIRALLGLGDYTTNVNLPNMGQIPNLPLGIVVETNAAFRDNSVDPIFAGAVPEGVWQLVSRAADAQAMVATAARERDLDLAFKAFANDPLVNLDLPTARKLFDEMVENTKEYLIEYFK